MLRAVKRTALSTLRTAGVFDMASRTRWRNDRLLILGYHGIAQDDEHHWDPALFITAETLERRLRFLKKAGFKVLPLAEGLDRLYSGRLPQRSVAVTFDDGYVDFYRQAYPVLKAYDVPATVYLTTYYSEKDHPPPAISASYMLWKRRSFAGRVTVIPGFDAVDLRNDAVRRMLTRAAVQFFDERSRSADCKYALLATLAAEIGFDFDDFRQRRILHLMNPEETRAVADAGVDVQLHSHRHAVPRDEASVRREIDDNRNRIEALTGRPADHFCYPSGVYYPELLPWLRSLKIRSATTCSVGLASSAHDPLLLPRFLDHSGVSQVEFEAWAVGVLPRGLARSG